MLEDRINEAISSKKTYLSDRLSRLGLVSAAVLNIIHWLVLLINIQPSREKILLHFNVVYGADLVAASFFLYLIPAVALVFFAVNLFLGSRLYNKNEKLAAYFLSSFSVLVQVIFLIATIILININA
ncbi:MAG: hypothetical protein HYW51_02705 [Candidatus Doudnabacteria bacterium]|nr:hypothetical protein [Candidatus Doudnabacteria bacterium]